MEGSQQSKCRSCGANLKWIKTPRGKSMPLDAVPITNVWTKNEQLDKWFYNNEAYVSHFSTCPNAEQHRSQSPAPMPQAPGFDEQVPPKAPLNGPQAHSADKTYDEPPISPEASDEQDEDNDIPF